MAAGKLGNAALAANADTVLYTVPASVVATVNVSFCNKGAASAKVRLAVAANAAPAAAEYLEFDTVIPANGVLERTGIVCSTTEKVVARADTADVAVRVHGFEE